MQDLGSEMSHLGCFLERNLLKIFGVLDLARVCCADSVHIGPYLYPLSIYRHTDQGCGIVRAATAEDCLLACEIGSNETLSDYGIHAFICLCNDARDSLCNLIHNRLALEI